MDGRNRKGIGGHPVGPGITGREQKFANTGHLNTLNKGVPLNSYRVLNTDRALNEVQEVVFKSTDDILRILQTHPDFHRASKDAYEPLLASLLSAATGGAGVVCLYISGGSSIGPVVLLLKSVGSAAMAGGVAGARNALMDGIKGTFSWHKWGEEVATSAAVALFTVAPTYFTGYQVANFGFSYLKLVPTNDITAELFLSYREWVKRLTKVSTAAVHSFLQTMGAVAKAKVKNKDLDPVSLVLTLVQSALSGADFGATITDQVLQKHLEQHISRLIE